MAVAEHVVRSRLLAWLAGIVLLVPTVGRPHGLDPASLSLREIRTGVFEVRWRASALRLPGADVQPRLPVRCRQTGPADAVDQGDRIELRWTVDCGSGGLAGEALGVDDLAVAKINALLTIDRLDAERIEVVLSPTGNSFTIPTRPSSWDVTRAYARLGVARLVARPDHLLCVFGLLLLVSTSRLLLRTLTAFALGHSLTLSAAALHVANVPSRAVEVLIALGMLLLAVELARDADHPTILRRFPWAMAVVFGLMHGFVFARGLAEAGLPPADGPLALASFNGGIELGQLAFVGVVLAAARGVGQRLPARSMPVAVYAMGVFSAFWCFERIAAWLGGA